MVSREIIIDDETGDVVEPPEPSPAPAARVRKVLDEPPSVKDIQAATEDDLAEVPQAQWPPKHQVDIFWQDGNREHPTVEDLRVEHGIATFRQGKVTHYVNLQQTRSFSSEEVDG